jgi:hypothetical protein
MNRIRQWLARGTAARHVGVLALLCATIFPLARFVQAIPVSALYAIPLLYVLYIAAYLLARSSK